MEISRNKNHSDDYKLALSRVLPALSSLVSYSDVTDLVRRADELERLTTTDCRTGVLNRHFLYLAENEWERFTRYQRSLSLLVFDIDNLKAINDRYSHKAGD